MLITKLALAVLAGFAGEEVTTKFVPSGAMPRVGGYMPRRAEMDGKPDSLKKLPPGIVAPKVGAIAIGDKSWKFVLDEPADKPAKLFVDTNNDGDLTNDPAAEWTSRTQGGSTMFNGKAQVDLGGGKLASLGVYRFDPNDKGRQALKNTLLFYTDFGYEVSLTLDGKKFTSFTDAESKIPLWIDRDENKIRSSKFEMIRLGTPFNFTGTTYVLTRDGENFKLAKADKPVPQLPFAPDIRVGKKAISFTKETMHGGKIEFPGSYAGKLVLLDFWATWCGPCIGEIPNVKKAYADHHSKGFEVLGVSFDDEGMTAKIDEFLKKQELPWNQIYEGKGWQTSLGEAYDVSSIPFVLLVDGDTGEILATTKELRGPGLSEFIGKKLAKKKEDAKKP